MQTDCRPSHSILNLNREKCPTISTTPQVSWRTNRSNWGTLGGCMNRTELVRRVVPTWQFWHNYSRRKVWSISSSSSSYTALLTGIDAVVVVVVVVRTSPNRERERLLTAGKQDWWRLANCQHTTPTTTWEQLMDTGSTRVTVRMS